jgi:hypothetical protein
LEEFYDFLEDAPELQGQELPDLEEPSRIKTQASA